MGKMKWIAGSAMLFFCLTAGAQKQSAQPEQNNNTPHQTAQNPASNSGQTGDKTSGRNQSAGTADAPGAQEAAASANEAGQQTAGQEPGSGSTTQAASNTPAVPQTTTSQSGSPAMLSEDGSGRDGTNNVQRATMNMAGAPAGNLNLENVQTGDADKELKDRQDYTQEKQISANQTGNSGVNASADTGKINDNTRRENDAQSDQTLSAKESKVSDKKSEEVKSAKKSKRKKGRG